MSQDLYRYLQQFYQFIQAQEKRILSLEKLVMEQKKAIDELKARPPVQVGTIEYKFDQLKVESLEGTLNIGLNPTDLQDIHDFAVENKNISAPPFSPKKQNKGAKDLEGKVLRYLETELPEVIKDAKEKLGIQFDDETYIEFIKEDIRKQIPGRIHHYLTQSNIEERSQEDRNEALEKILYQIKDDIKNAVYAFISNMPEEMKG